MASSVSSTLKLVIEKGPREGETLEFNPRSTIRLGRVVRGNNLPIKDPGISSKHLSIDFNSDTRNWQITDLDSSNGTLLNSSQLKPFSPFEVRNGDEIKIGELTSIRVEIVEISVENSIRRNPRRQAAPKSGVDLGGKVEVGGSGAVRVRDVELESGRENRRGRGRGRPRNGENGGNLVVNENVESVKVEQQECGVSTRRTRNSKSEREGGVMPARMTRSSAKNVENVTGSSVLEKVPEIAGLGEVNSKEGDNVGLVENKKRGGRGRTKKVNTGCLDDANTKNKEMPEFPVAGVSEQTCEERKDDPVRHTMLEETNTDVSKLEVPDHLEGVELAGEQPCEEPADDAQKRMLESTDGEVSELPVASGREQTCEKVADDTAQHNMCEETNRDVTESEVLVREEGVVLAGEKSGEEPTDATEKTTLEKTSGKVLELSAASVREQTCEERVDDAAQRNMVEEANRDVSELENPEQEEGAVHSGEQPSEEPVDDFQKTLMENTNRVVSELPVVTAEEQTCEERVDGTAQHNMFEETNKDVSELDVPEQAGCVMDAREQLCEAPTDDTSRRSVFEETIRTLSEPEVPKQAGSVPDAGEQPCVEPTHDTQMTLLEKTNIEGSELKVSVHAEGVLEAEEQPCRESIDKTGQRKEGIVSASQLTHDELECDLLLEDGEGVESEMEEISEESDVDVDGKEKNPEASDAPDLEKMTLGEWFDYLEVYLPKQIHDATDAVIADMRKSAKQFNDFMLQQQNDKGKFPVAT